MIIPIFYKGVCQSSGRLIVVKAVIKPGNLNFGVGSGALY